MLTVTDVSRDERARDDHGEQLGPLGKTTRQTESVPPISWANAGQPPPPLRKGRMNTQKANAVNSSM